MDQPLIPLFRHALRLGEQCEKERYPRHRPGRAECGHTGLEQRNSLLGLPAPRQCASLEDRSGGTAVGKSMLVRDGDERIRPRQQFVA